MGLVYLVFFIKDLYVLYFLCIVYVFLGSDFFFFLVSYNIYDLCKYDGEVLFLLFN